MKERQPVFLAFLSVLFFPQMSTWEDRSDASILLSIKETMGVDLPIFSTWNPNFSPCDTWVGITCSALSGAGVTTRVVTGINLHNVGLSGQVPPSVCDIKYLTSLDISQNFIPNLPPTFLLNCAYLNYLDFSNNKLTGILPATLCSHAPLTSILGYGNYLSGESLQSLSPCKNLSVLRLSNNRLTGEIPDELWNSPSLNYLDLSNNELSGGLPAAIANSMLNFLNLSNNMLSGAVSPPFDKVVYSRSFVNTNLCTTGNSYTFISLPRCTASSSGSSNNFSSSLKYLAIPAVIILLVLIGVFVNYLRPCTFALH